MSEELKPCPFCGGTDLMFRQDESEDKPVMLYAWHVFCRDCHCHGRNNYPIGWCESKLAASQAWNDRKPDDASNTLIEGQAERIAALEAEIELAKNDLRSFMTSFVREHFFDNDGWRSLPDLLGMLSQMDNASTVARTYRDRADDSQARLSEAVKVLEEIAQMPGVNGGHYDIGEEFRNTQSLRLNEQCRALAKRFLATLGEESHGG